MKKPKVRKIKTLKQDFFSPETLLSKSQLKNIKGGIVEENAEGV